LKRPTETLDDWIGVPTVGDHNRQIIDKGECRTAIDIGCGEQSCLSAFRPRIVTAGADGHAPAIETSRANSTHDFYICADVIRDDVGVLLQPFDGKPVDLVTLIGVIEHLPKGEGHKLLEKCERLTSKYIVVETPNGFLEQGPEFGNEYQRHRSGWFPQDLEGYGYSVFGATGTKYLRGYMAGPKYDFKGAAICDIILARLLGAYSHPRHAFNLIAMKDVRGVPARYSRKGFVPIP
jgi:methyltransferase family protein